MPGVGTVDAACALIIINWRRLAGLGGCLVGVQVGDA